MNWTNIVIETLVDTVSHRRRYLCAMKKIIYCFICLCTVVPCLHAQNDYCLKLTDTVHIQAKLVTVNFPDVIGDPYCYFIVFNDDDVNDVVNRYLTKSPQKQDQLYLVSHLSSNQFIAIRKVVEDTLYEKLSAQKIGSLLLFCDKTDSLPAEFTGEEDKTQIGEFVFKGTTGWESAKSLLTLIDENCIQKKASKDISQLWGREKKPYPLYYEVCVATFDSWGVILERGAGCCDFFYNNDYESHHFNETLNLFIPLSPKDQ